MGNPITYAAESAALALAWLAGAAVVADDESSGSDGAAIPADGLQQRGASTPRTVVRHSEIDGEAVAVCKSSNVAAFASGFVSASLAETITLPLDTGKVRMQLDVQRSFTSPMQAMAHVAQSEGIDVLWGGLPAGILRAGLMYSVRLMAYDPMLTRVARARAGADAAEQEASKSSVATKLLTAIPCAALSVCVANPADVLKVRFQKNSQSYTSSSISPKTVADIIRREGFFGGLYSGFLPNVTRNCAVGGAELVGYYQSKECLVHSIGMRDATPAHVLASFGAALSALLIGSPFDVLGTRLMQAEAVAEGKGLLGSTGTMFRQEGIAGFYKGGSMNLARLWGFNLVFWLGFEGVQRKFKAWGV